MAPPRHVCEADAIRSRPVRLNGFGAIAQVAFVVKLYGTPSRAPHWKEMDRIFLLIIAGGLIALVTGLALIPSESDANAAVMALKERRSW
jgi:hypothetical protein